MNYKKELNSGVIEKLKQKGISPDTYVQRIPIPDDTTYISISYRRGQYDGYTRVEKNNHCIG